MFFLREEIADNLCALFYIIVSLQWIYFMLSYLSCIITVTSSHWSLAVHLYRSVFYAETTSVTLLMSQMSLEREKELRKDDVAQLQFEVDQMKQKAADLQIKLVRFRCWC